MQSQTNHLSVHLARLGLQLLDVSDLSRMFGVTPQRVYQMRAASRDRDMPLTHVKTLKWADQVADAAADYQVKLYQSKSAVSDVAIQERYGEDLEQIRAFLTHLPDHAPHLAKTVSVILSGAKAELARNARADHWENSLFGADWYIRTYESPLGVPPFPPIGEHNGQGFFNLYTIAMQRACERIRQLGGNPLVGVDWVKAFSDIQAEHDASMWERELGVLAVPANDPDDVPAETGRKWKWEFEPG